MFALGFIRLISFMIYGEKPTESSQWISMRITFAFLMAFLGFFILRKCGSIWNADIWHRQVSRSIFGLDLADICRTLTMNAGNMGWISAELFFFLVFFFSIVLLRSVFLSPWEVRTIGTGKHEGRWGTVGEDEWSKRTQRVCIRIPFSLKISCLGGHSCSDVWNPHRNRIFVLDTVAISL